MGYDVMTAWAQRTFEFNNHIQSRGNSWGGRFSFDSVEGRSVIHPEYEPPLSPPQSSDGPGIADQADSQRLPIKSSHVVAMQGSPEARSPQSPQSPASPNSPSLITSSPLTPLTPMDRHNLTSRLYQAACTGDLQQIELLLALGAPINTPSMVSGLYEAFKPAKSGTLSALAGAAGSHQLRAVELLLSHGADVNPDVKHSSSSPLHQACRANDLEISRHLLAAGALVNALNCYKTTPLMYAGKHGSPALVALLLEYRPDLHIVSFINATAIHWAVWPGNAEIMELLLKAGADPNQRMGDGGTPLHCAAIAGATETARCLVRHGADPRLRNDAGLTAEEVAERNGFARLAEAIKEAQLKGILQGRK